MRQFPASVINRVLICNRDECTYQHVTDLRDGCFDVDFDLQPQSPGVVLRDTLKFHFYTGNSIPIVVAAGGVPIDSLVKLMAQKPTADCKVPSPLNPTTFECNFSPVGVQLMFKPPAEPLAVEMPAMEKSALRTTEEHMELLNKTCASLAVVLASNLIVSPQNGGPMFCNLMSAHNMMNEATAHSFYQSDVQPGPKDSELFHKSGLTMVALASGLQAKCLTVEQALSMDTKSAAFTGLAAEVCQAFIRSAHICPYVPDKVLAAGLDSAGLVKHVVSESFKLPFREPFIYNKTGSGYLHADDCEGHAAFLLYLFNSFKDLYEQRVPQSLLYPKHLFNISNTEKDLLYALATKIGALASEGKLRCDIILISAGSAALGDGGDQLGGHATCVMVNASNKDSPIDLLMEGTNSMGWDDDDRAISITKAGLVPIQLPLVTCANILTQNAVELCGPADEADCRMLIHLNKALETKFYKTAFCQNGYLVVSPGSKPTEITFGVSMDQISNYDKKVYMPVTKELINKLTDRADAHDFMAMHRELRKVEIHPPRTTIEKVAEAVAHWSPIELYRPAAELEGRKFKVCMAMRSIRDQENRHQVYAASKVKVTGWNEKFKDIGHCTTYLAFDTIFTRVCMWTDNLDALQSCLSSAISAKPE